ncbi:DUF6153 family protein [Microbacterium sp. G2-8]|uniref:DUF6153 family protein n=1 Tax=Microbacterium sp. G2-8 TaxID=2842454 RepID=UPI001C8ACB30|nr:DUF6153 family protein [Microbacterium sp. G2-8]
MRAASAGPRDGRRRTLRRLLGAGALVAVVIVGLLAMHTLDQRGLADPPAAGASASVAAPASDGHDGLCPTCGADDAAGMTIACAMALFLVLLLVLPRGAVTAWMRAAWFPHTRPLAAAPAPPRPPSLHALCISRT